jgi:hypothetical protein
MKIPTGRANAILAVFFAIVGCSEFHLRQSNEGNDTKEGDSFSKVQLGMHEHEIDLGTKGREFVPAGWPQTLGEIPEYADHPFKAEKIWWVIWRVPDAHNWIAVGFARTDNCGGSLTLTRAVIKKSGLNGPDYPPEAVTRLF